MVGHIFYGLMKVMGRYNQCNLHTESKPLKAFKTMMGRLQLTCLLQGAKNLVAVYQAQMMWLLQAYIQHVVHIFINDMTIKDPKIKYGCARLVENPNIWMFVWE
jgi:hypothetical protein